MFAVTCCWKRRKAIPNRAKLHATTVAVALMLITPHSSSAAGWVLSWSDEFSGPTVDTSVWGFEIGHVRNNEAQYYSNRTENSRIENSMLHIQALRDNWNGNQYTSASRTNDNLILWFNTVDGSTHVEMRKD